jgi:AcrR family transcriptional regulator
MQDFHTMSTVQDRLSPRAARIAQVARALLEEEGIDGVSMRGLATRLGIKAPSLYKHFTGKEEIEAVLISIGFEEQAELFRAALENSPEPIVAMGDAYRAFAMRNPQLYRLMFDRALNRPLLTEGAEAAAAAPSLEATSGDLALARAAFAFAHGMTILELNGRFPEDADLDAAWRWGLGLLQAAAGKQRSSRSRSSPSARDRE